MAKKFPSWLIVLVIIGVCIFGVFGKYKNTYNKLVTLDESVSAQWAEVQNQYQRRYDLIPNLVATVKGYAKHENDVFSQISQARASAGGQVNISEDILNNPEAFAKYQQVQDNLGASLQRLLVITENYPELKADQNFMALQDQLEGTENRITVARQRFNSEVQKYNTSIRTFPNNIIANMSGFEKKQMFTAGQEAQSAPIVSF